MGVFTTVKTNDVWADCQIKTGDDWCQELDIGGRLSAGGEPNEALDGWYWGVSGDHRADSYSLSERHLVLILNYTVQEVLLLPERFWNAVPDGGTSGWLSAFSAYPLHW